MLGVEMTDLCLFMLVIACDQCGLQNIQWQAVTSILVDFKN